MAAMQSVPDQIFVVGAWARLGMTALERGVGPEVYNRIMGGVVRECAGRKLERRKKVKAAAVLRPERAAQRRVKKNLKKKVGKKEKKRREVGRLRAHH